MFLRSHHVRAYTSLAMVSLATLLSGCSSEHGNSPLSRKTTIKTQPISTWVWGKYVDEDSPLDYYVKFRNTGKDIITFDYTIADRKDVPHLDRNGPNSGLIPNLYPGVEVTIPNPLKRWDVFVKVGRVVHGKKTNDELQRVFPSDAAPSGAELSFQAGSEPLGLASAP